MVGGDRVGVVKSQKESTGARSLVVKICDLGGGDSQLSGNALTSCAMSRRTDGYERPARAAMRLS
jgi:hypothetical protein